MKIIFLLPSKGETFYSKKTRKEMFCNNQNLIPNFALFENHWTVWLNVIIKVCWDSIKRFNSRLELGKIFALFDQEINYKKLIKRNERKFLTNHHLQWFDLDYRDFYGKIVVTNLQIQSPTCFKSKLCWHPYSNFLKT